MQLEGKTGTEAETTSRVKDEDTCRERRLHTNVEMFNKIEWKF